MRRSKTITRISASDIAASSSSISHASACRMVMHSCDLGFLMPYENPSGDVALIDFSVISIVHPGGNDCLRSISAWNKWQKMRSKGLMFMLWLLRGYP